MFYTFIISGDTSTLTTKINPPIILDDNSYYVMGLVDFMSSNTIVNVDKTNNKFYIGEYALELPEGNYEITDIEKKLQDLLKLADDEALANTLEAGAFESTLLSLKANQNTFKCEIKSNREINFLKPNTIGTLLGFKKKILKPEKKHFSSQTINISSVNSICIDCNIIQNSFNNDLPGHIIHMFYPNVPPGYKIVQCPTNVIYLPINTRFIDEIILKITDQHGKSVNFKSELITVRLHLKKII